MLDLNTLIVVSLAVLAFLAFILVIVLIPIAMQLSRTLGSMQVFFDTVNDDVRPAVKEIKQGVYTVKGALYKCSALARHGATQGRDFIVSSAHGVLVGVKEYLSACKTDQNSYNGRSTSDKQ